MAVLDGGLAAWKAANYPLTTTLPQISKAVYQGTPDPTKLATGKWILKQLSTPEVLLIDTRSRAEFEGKRSGSGSRIAGHIPGAVNIEWVRNLTNTIPYKILPPETLQSLYESIRVSLDTTIVVYSQSGALLILILYYISSVIPMFASTMIPGWNGQIAVVSRYDIKVAGKKPFLRASSPLS